MTAALKNDTFIRAALREETPYTPVGIMRQAGRYLPEYNATRARAGSFLALAKNPDFATEVTLQPLSRFPLDAAILFSDILTVPDAMGLGLYFAEGEGPLKFERPVRGRTFGAPSDCAGPTRHAAVRRRCGCADSSRSGRSGAAHWFLGKPDTLACYMVEGGASADFQTIKTMLYARPGAIALDER